jgi:hypothetical protein
VIEFLCWLFNIAVYWREDAAWGWRLSAMWVLKGGELKYPATSKAAEINKPRFYISAVANWGLENPGLRENNLY